MVNEVSNVVVKDDNTGIDDLSTSLREPVYNIIKDEGYLNCVVKQKPVNVTGHFLGLMREVDIQGETVDGVKQMSLFIKESVTLEKIALVTVSDIYAKEQFFYKDLSKLFSRLENEAKIPEHERLQVLKTYESNNDGIIIMENLVKKGFKTHPRTQVVDIKFAELSIAELAKFHVMSFVIRKKVPKYFEEKIVTMNSCYNLDSDWQCFMDNVCAVAAGVLEGDVKEKIRNYAPRLVRMYKKYLQETVPSNGCVCHGDYKFLNVLFKEVEGEATEIQPIDYQMMYFGNPVDDLLFFIFTGTDRKFRQAHLEHLKELYFESFTKFLRYFDMDVASTYPRREFEKDYRERFELGLVYGLYVAVFTFAHVEEGFDVNKLSLSELPLIPDEMYEDRVRGIVEDYVDWGYL